MSSESQREWSELSELWRESAEPLDAAAIRRRIRRRSWLANIWFAGELLLCLAALAIAGVFIARWTWPSNLVGVTLLLYTCFALGLTCWSHSLSLPLWLRLVVIACLWAPIVWRCIHLLRRGRSELAGLMAIRRELLAE